MKETLITIFLIISVGIAYFAIVPHKLGCLNQKQLKARCVYNILHDYKKNPYSNNFEKLLPSDYSSIYPFCECFSELIWKTNIDDRQGLKREKVYISDAINYCSEKFPIKNTITEGSLTKHFRGH